MLNKIAGDRIIHHDEQLLRFCGDQAATSIENSQLYENVHALREKEFELTKELKRQHRQLQEAFHEIEASKEQLETELTGKRWTWRTEYQPDW